MIIICNPHDLTPGVYVNRNSGRRLWDLKRHLCKIAAAASWMPLCVCRFEKCHLQSCVSGSIVLSMSHAVVIVWKYSLKTVMCCRVWSIFEVCHMQSCVSGSVVLSMSHAVVCLWKYCLKTVMCCRVLGRIVWSVSNAVTYLKKYFLKTVTCCRVSEAFFVVCHMQSCVSGSTV
jgi:hypothetical protein